MDIFQAMKERHSVRSYLDKPISPDAAAKLNEEIECINKETGLNIQLILNEKDAFNGFLATYGMLKGVKNYIALVGEVSPCLEEQVGYYGEKLVLMAQMFGLNTCWVGGSFSRKKVKAKINEGEKLVLVIAIGYAKKQGTPHRNKPMGKLCKVEDDMPEWFLKGMEASMLAPTAINQQRFLFTQMGDGVKAEALTGPFSKVDLGIVKYHFEIGAGKDNFQWI